MTRVDSRTDPDPTSAELVRAMVNLDAFLARSIDIGAAAGPTPHPDPLHGLYIVPADIPALLHPPAFNAALDPAADLLRGLPRFRALAEAERLDAFEAAVLVLAAAPELDQRYERVFGYLNDDLTRRYPTVDLALNLLCRSLEEKVAARERFTPAGRLVRSGLLRLVPDPSQLEPPLLAHALKADEHVVQWLSVSTRLHSRLAPIAGLSTPQGPFPPALDDALDARWTGNGVRWAVVGQASLAVQTAQAIASRLGRQLLVARMSEAGAAASAATLFRQARLGSAVVLLEGLDRIDADADRRLVASALADHDGPVLAESHPDWARDAFTSVDLGSGGQMVTATRIAGDRTSPLMRRLQPVYCWDDLILPDTISAQLREICDQASHQHVVMSRWGFGRKVRGGGQLTALFSGPSGTGKTMAAEVVSAELGLELYRIDLSQVMSKFIGETEKNLGSVFDLAEKSGAVLFFDEADALFGKRSSVRDSHDRYANVEVSYLLQRMEEYRGVAILATNLRHNMDAAFLRRLRFSVEFPFPDDAMRRRIWAVQFPAEAPLAADVDFEQLARRFPLAGGGIRNVALNAAYLAAAAGEAIAMPHVIRAVRREYQKMGRPIAEEEFGPYHALLQTAGPP
jgi:hypothetical protein